MTRPPGDGSSTGRGEPGSPSNEFEAAQREVFDAVGLDARSRFVDLESPQVRTHVFEAGRSDDGAPLLFVHGSNAFGAFLASLMAHLDDCRLVGLDRPGYGLSGDFTYTERNLRRTDVDVLDGVVDELGVERVDLVGHSMGGYASVLFALARPDRVRRLILVGGTAAFPGTWPPLPLRLMTVPVLNRLLRRVQKSGEEGVLDMADVFGERETVQDHPALVRAIAAHERDPKSSRAGMSELSAFFSVRGWHPSVPLREAELRDVSQPTLVIWGENDPIGSPDDVRTGIELIPDVRLETTPTAHVPYFAHPGRCARFIREFRGTETRDVE